MSFFRVAPPALLGALLLALGATSISTGLGYGDGLEHVRTSAIPIAVGIVMLLGAAMIARRTRLGALLGIGIGALMVLAGLGIIVLEIPYLQKGGEGAAFGSAFVVVASIWSALWAVYTWRFWAARSGFAASWVAADRRLAAVVGVVVAGGAATFLALGAYQAQAAQGLIDSEGAAQGVVVATTLEVRAFDPTFVAAPSGGGQVVDRMTIQVDLQSPQAYSLAAAPSLCLTSAALFRDPAHKPGNMCWGMPGPDDALRFSAISTGIPQDTTTITLELRGSGSPCPFPPGQWNAELTLAPSIAAGTDGIGPAPERYTIDATFFVGSDAVVPPPSGDAPAELGCLGVSP